MDKFLAFSVVLAFLAWAFISVISRRRRSRLPPGPYPFPVIGNILQIGKNPNQSLAKLAKTYGPLMSLKLGSKTTIIVSSPTVAKEVLQKHDQIFSSRTIPNAARAHDHHKYSMAWLPASARPWRNLRKISKEYMFSSQKLDAIQGLRHEKLRELRDYLLACSAQKQSVNIGQAAFTTTLNLLSNTLFAIDFAAYDSDSSHELKDIACGIMNIIGTPNIVDYFPAALQVLDLQGILRQSQFFFGKMLDILDSIIDERKVIRGSLNGSSKKKDDLLEALLDQNEAEFSRNDIKHLLLDLFVGGTDTTSATVEWAMTELLRNPEKMARARVELDRIIGKKETVMESDILRLPYLQAIVKETFRLYPAAPFLIPHKAEADVEINGYLVPKNAEVLVNVWASGRDSETWSDPETFSPDRFLLSEIDAKGKHFELIPFGAGRRICPGLPLAYRMVHLMVATLIHWFDWKLEDGMRPEDIDIEEKFGLSIQKAVPLSATPVEI